MKDSQFLKGKLFANKGVYDNSTIFENTLESFSEAIRRGMGLLLNVRLTQDNIMVVYHDEDLARILNLKDRIDTTTYEELNYLCSYHIPTLDEVLKITAGQVPLVINPHFKKFRLHLPELAKMIDEYQCPVAVINHNPVVIKWFNKNRPAFYVGEILTRKLSFNLLAHLSIVTDFKTVNVDYYNLKRIHELKKNNVILGYLIDQQEKYNDYVDLCDSLFIDNIGELSFKA